MIKSSLHCHSGYGRSHHRELSLCKNGSLISWISPIEDHFLFQQALLLIKNLNLSGIGIQLYIEATHRLHGPIFCHPIYSG